MLVEFTLTADGDERTRLRVREPGLDLLDWTAEPTATYTDAHRHGWAVHLGRLADLLAR